MLADYLMFLQGCSDLFGLVLELMVGFGVVAFVIRAIRGAFH